MGKFFAILDLDENTTDNCFQWWTFGYLLICVNYAGWVQANSRPWSGSIVYTNLFVWLRVEKWYLTYRRTSNSPLTDYTDTQTDLRLGCFFLFFFFFMLALKLLLKRRSTKATSEAKSVSPGPSCSKLTMSLVNDSLKFTLSDTKICWNYLLKKCE